MRMLITTLFLFASAVVLAAGENEDLAKLQGKWLVVTLTEQGKAIPAAETDLLEFTVAKDEFTVTEKGKTVVQYRIVVDGSKKPGEINFTHLIGENKGKTELGIFQFEKDYVKLCIDESRKGRPKGFEGKEADDYSVIVLKKKP